MGSLYMGRRKGKVSPPSLCFYKASLGTLIDDVFIVFAESSDLCLLQKWGSKCFFPSTSTDPATVMAWQTQVSWVQSQYLLLFFSKHTHTQTLSVSFDSRDADIISYTVVFPPVFEDTSELQNKCTVWTTAKEGEVRVQIYPKLLNTF